ncbi:MAG: general secretion pathway protein GspK [Proteobacteria bacterium]|nr:general secretion pathway protein GspK [Pseudomonadota bacterium]
MMGRSQQHNRGAALVLVLWLVAALSLVVLASAQGMRLQTRRVGVELERMRAEQMLDAALELGAQRLMVDRGAPGRYREWRMPMGDAAARLEIIPAAGLVDVNVATEQLLEAVLEKIGGLPPGEANIMASRIKDFIDPDDAPSGAGGAEAPQYRAAGRIVMPRNAPVDDLSELQMVLGMTPQLYGIISPYLGINGKARIAVDAAPPALIDKLTGQPGLGARIHSTPLEGRADLLTGVAANFFSPDAGGGGGALKLRASVRTQDGRWWQREAWVDLSERPDTLTPWTTLSLEPTRRMQTPQQEMNP